MLGKGTKTRPLRYLKITEKTLFGTMVAVLGTGSHVDMFRNFRIVLILNVLFNVP